MDTLLGFGLPLWQAVVWIGMGVSIWFSVIAVYSGRKFFRYRREEDQPAPDWTPAVTILKPLKGPEPQLYDNLLTFCRQEYPRLQIVFGVADADDPAADLVRRLQREYPEVDIDLVIDGRAHGTNFKVSNLINMYARAKHDVLVLADSDIRVSQGYVYRIVAPLRSGKIGLVSCLYRAVAADGLPTLLWALCLNTTFSAQILVARQVEDPTYAFGASMAVRRSTLEAIGGFRPLANMLADDYHLGHRIAARGLTLWLNDCVVDTVLDVGSARGLFRHLIRRARTNRSCRPGGYFCTIFTNGVLWALLNLITSGAGALPLCASLLTASTRVAAAGHLSRRFLRRDFKASSFILLPLADLLAALTWAVSFFGSTVWWSGRRYRILKSGHMEILAAKPSLARAGLPAKESSPASPILK